LTDLRQVEFPHRPEYTPHSLRDDLQAALAFEFALMAQYLYAAMTCVPPPGANAAEEDCINAWSTTLSKLATSEMFHIAAVANIIVANNEVPDFGAADFGKVRNQLNGKWITDREAFALTPFSAGTLMRLASYEYEEAALPKPPQIAIEVSLGIREPVRSIGSLYRRILAGLEHLDWQPVEDSHCYFSMPLLEHGLGSDEQMLILPSRVDDPKRWALVAWAVLQSGEGGTSDTGPKGHFARLTGLLADVGAQLQLWRKMNTQRFMSDPVVIGTCSDVSVRIAKPGERGSPVNDPLVRETAMALSWCYMLLVQLLSCLWRDSSIHGEDGNPWKAKCFAISKGVMKALFGQLGGILVSLEGRTGCGSLCGPTFELPDNNSVHMAPAWSDALVQLRGSTENVRSYINSAMKLSSSESIRRRFENAMETCAHLRRRIEELGDPNPAAHNT
jgi:hypothetical protein